MTDPKPSKSLRVVQAAVLMSMIIGCAATPTAPTTPSASISDSELPRHSWEEEPDFKSLRESWGWSDSYTELCQSGRPIQEMVEQMNSEQWELAAETGNRWLNQCPVDMRLHHYTGISLAESDKSEQAEHHFRWASGLMDSLVASGDGMSPETAYFTISIAESYDALYFFGIEFKSQSLISEPVMADLFIGENEAGEEVSLYFNPAPHFARLIELFGQ